MPRSDPPKRTPPRSELPSTTGRIVRLYAEMATVELEGGAQTAECVIRGRLFRTEPPAVGDLVRLERHGQRGVITEVLPRRSVLARRAAGTIAGKQVLIANIDLVVVVFAAVMPEPHLPALDRFLAVVEANDLEGHIVVNKMDLAPERAAIEELFARYSRAGYPLHYTSAATGEGLGQLEDVLAGRESAFVGPSGVGKSSLLNALYPGLDLRVGQVSESHGKGRHTTVGGTLIRLPGGASVADTAGLREVGLWLVPPDELPHCFPEFREHLGDCRFSDCAHVAEPECAVRTAVEDGEIDPERYASYVKLREEALEAWPRW